MEMVQEQGLQLKIKFSLSYNMKIVILREDKNLVRAFFLVEEDYPRVVLIMEF